MELASVPLWFEEAISEMNQSGGQPGDGFIVTATKPANHIQPPQIILQEFGSKSLRATIDFNPNLSGLASLMEPAASQGSELEFSLW